jgi:cytoskeleton protein RodZ
MDEIGSTLREARIRARIDMSEVESRTKIRAKYLRAIENEEWDLLPGPVYAKSFLRTYGDFLGLDSRMLLDEFKRRYERPPNQEQRPMASLARERERRPRGPRLPPWTPIAAAVVVIVAILFVVGSLNHSSNSTPTSTHTHRTHPTRHHRASSRTKTIVPPPAPATATLHLVPTALVYVCLVDGKGTKLIDAQEFTVGQTIPTEKARKLLLTLGNASVTMTVNGKPVPVAPSPTAIRLEITAKGVTPISEAQPPSCP